MLSEYERFRQSNIERQADFLRSIGLSDANTLGSACINHHVRSGGTEDVASRGSKRRGAVVRSEQGAEDGMRRVSRRLAKCAEESVLEHASETRSAGVRKVRSDEREMDWVVEEGEEEDHPDRRSVTAELCRALIESLSEADSAAVSDKELRHCVSRVREMGPRQLRTRLNLIARHAYSSRKSREKLLVFHYALLTASLFSLAAAARLVLDSLPPQECTNIG